MRTPRVHLPRARAAGRRAASACTVCLAPVLAVVGCAQQAGTEEVAANVVYNGTYTGPGTVQRDPAGWAHAAVESTTVSITFSQLGSDFSGPLTSTPPGSVVASGGALAGTTTLTGGSFTYVQASAAGESCAGTLHGAFTLAGGRISGAATGRDCLVGPAGDDVRITFADLARQP